MKNKKMLICICVFVFLLIAIIAFLYIFSSNSNNNSFDTKISMLQKLYRTDNKSQSKDNIVIMSICDMENKAIVKSKRGYSVNNAYQLLKNEVSSYVKQNNYNASWVKLDIIQNVKEVSMEDFNKTLSDLAQEYTYRNGIILNFADTEVILTETELNSNMIIDYDNHKLDLSKLNKYLKSRGDLQLRILPTTLKTFTTLSYFCDENNNTYKLYNEGANTGRRVYDNLDKSQIDYIVQNASDYLFNMIQDDGKFIYGYNPLKDTENNSYNILRHAGSVWSCIVSFDGSNDKKSKINLSLDYLNNTIRKKDDNTYFIAEVKDSEIKLGGNALSIIAMCEYTDKFSDSKYIDTIKKLGNGILSMQHADGSYTHVLNEDNYSIKDEYRTVFYDGEATFALCKLYGVTKDEKYLNAAKKSIDYFIEKDYTIYADHWISYATNEITKYVDDEKYYEFGLKNVGSNINQILEKQYTSHINLEMIVKCNELYNRMIEKNINVKYTNYFPYDELKELLNARLHFQLNSYLYPEMAMYLSNPSKYCNTFFIRHSDFRIRIDDIQHSILGYYYSKDII